MHIMINYVNKNNARRRLDRGDPGLDRLRGEPGAALGERTIVISMCY